MRKWYEWLMAYFEEDAAFSFASCEAAMEEMEQKNSDRVYSRTGRAVRNGVVGFPRDSRGGRIGTDQSPKSRGYHADA